MFLTILTPTYNRKEKLDKLYNSLCKQTNKNFLWLIVDDGSNDNTSNLIQEYYKENKVKIEYIRKKNGGKHTAINFGMLKVQTPLVFIVDSDDWLSDDAIEQILKVHKKFATIESICGYSFLRMFKNGKVNGKRFEKDLFIDDYINIRINRNDTNSDKAEVWKTFYLKKFPFPEFPNEKFLGEDTIWIQMSMKYKMIFINKTIYLSEYLSEGLTKNRRKHNIQSPKGCLYRAKISLIACKERKINFLFFLKVLMQYHIYGRFAKVNFIELYKNSIFKIWFIITSPGGFGLYSYWKLKYLKSSVSAKKLEVN